MTIARGGGDLQWENAMEQRETPRKIAMEEVEVVEGVVVKMMCAPDARFSITPWKECYRLDTKGGGGRTIARGGGDLQWENAMERKETPRNIAMEEEEVVKGVTMEMMVVAEDSAMEVMEVFEEVGVEVVEVANADGGIVEGREPTTISRSLTKYLENERG